MLPCIYIDGRDTGADCPSVSAAPDVPSDMSSTGWITRKWGSVLHRNLALVCDPNTNKSLVKGVFMWFCVYFGVGSFLSE